MAGVKIKVDSHIDECSEELYIKVHDWLEGCAQDAVSTTIKVISGIPLVKTGRLKNSIASMVPADENTAYIGTNVEYAKYHELGTRKLPARHFLRDGVSKHASSYKSLLEQKLKE